ncbi:hypothetical protein U5801_21460 [Lamprobacter modestohalophilus]|uniref:hypothetical protein n=1 Tax=Lamprobacter modestohalophilus TaxID=1064514 RepID=UPI002ADEA85E|nr:hypothetical protein [Lamprobacter modestohalophilus]MEA1052353.1 hypothetical protein [Lamprobacter modestohalophilus]
MTETSVAQRAQQEIGGVIEIRQNKPMVSSLKIAELFERPHKSVLRVLRELSGVAQHSDEHLTAQKGGLPRRGRGAKTKDSAAVLDGQITWDAYRNSRGKEYPMAWLNERAALIAMPFIGGRNAHIGQRKLVDAYLYYRDAFANPPRSELIRAKRDASRLLTDSILDWRAFEGKDTDACHYMAEQKLCNWAITGQFAKLDESTLSNEDVELLREVWETNAALITAGVLYPDRKVALARLVMRRRTNQLRIAA